MADGVSKCGRKTALSVFFAVSLFGFLFCLISLLSSSWQLVYLENGRTEHHHGLWLDCKRDYSFDYGRTREYYETLYRHDRQGSPFAMFYLPTLQCVYKFDYWIDAEDLYDHDHDENRLQNDAYQHLFLGWKVAALVAVGVGVCFSAVSILMGICSFCHRTFICACTVLVTIAALLSTIGIAVFYIWGNYQDNKVINEENDMTYEQSFAWAFYLQIVGACLHWLASMLGCCVTSVSLSKTRAKLVKIEVVEGDESKLLSNSSSQPFKRSFSAIYRVDSQALRQWERDYMRNTQSVTATNTENNSAFQRTASVPNFSKKQYKQDRKRARQQNRSSHELFSSTSNITETTHTGSNLTLDTQRTRDTTRTTPAPVVQPELIVPATPKLKSALKTPQTSRKTINEDPTYEYLPCPSSMGVSSIMGGLRSNQTAVYDPVYESIGPEAYLEPNSVKAKASNLSLISKKALLPTQPVSGSSQSIPVAQQRTTVIDDVGRPVSWNTDKRNIPEVIKTRERLTIEEMTRLERFRTGQKTEPAPPSILKPKAPSVASKPQMTIRDFGIDLTKKTNGFCTEVQKQPVESSQKLSSDTVFGLESSADFLRSNAYTKPLPSHSRPRRSETTLDDGHETSTNGDDRGSVKTGYSDEMPDPPAGIAINTFGFGDKELRRSITNLTYRPATATAGEVFVRPESTDFTNTQKPPPKPTYLNKNVVKFIPDEVQVDRSVGSSTMLENDTMSEAGSYSRDAEIRLNLFIKDKGANAQDETTV